MIKHTSIVYSIFCIVSIAFADRVSAQCAFFDDFQRPDSTTIGFGWVEDETIASEILLTSFGEFGYVDIVGQGVAPVSMTQSNIDTSSLTNPAITFVWQGRNGDAEAGDVLQLDWRLSGGTWEQLGEFELTNTLTTVTEIPLPPAALNTSIDFRFVVIVDTFQEGVLLDDVGVCNSAGPTDCNSNGIDDELDIALGTSLDENANATPDECDECVFDVDCSNGLFCDGVEICLVDICQFQSPPCVAGQLCDEIGDVCVPNGADCNSNGIGDAFDIAGGTSFDLNANSVPDECDECVFDGDCDDGLFCTGVEVCSIDVCATGLAPCQIGGQVCNETTDQCDPDGADCNTNGIGDATDISGGFSDDLNANNIPDECDGCVFDADCDDGMFCNGDETCAVDTCVAGGDPCSVGEICDDTEDLCIVAIDCNSNGVSDLFDIAGGSSDDVNANEVPDECDECVVDGDCSNGLFCDGEEVCDVDQCIGGAFPCVAGQDCDEGSDACFPIGADCNSNAIGDAADIAGATSDDANSNGIPDECDACVFDTDCDDDVFCNGAESCNVDTCTNGMIPCELGQLCDEEFDLCQPDGSDCNTNGVGDAYDIALGTSADLNSNGVPDECDACVMDADCDDGLYCTGIETCNIDTCAPSSNPCLIGQTCVEESDTCAPTGADCNANGIGDATDIAAGTSMDCNSNGVPDACDIAFGDSNDCNLNAVPDDCDLLFGDAFDCNTNGALDECDIAEKMSDDCDTNGVPDECQSDDDADGVIDACDLCPDTPPGLIMGDAGCPLALGPCCFFGEICIDDRLESECTILDGTYLGDGFTCELDPDGDGVTGCDDRCPFDGQKSEPGICGCGVSDMDSDQDGLVDCVDRCPNTPLGDPVNACGCSALGACAFNQGFCWDELDETTCTLISGFYLGDGSLCDDAFTFGDFDLDGDADLVDFAYFQECFNASSDGETDWPCAAGDFDGCGDVDIADYEALFRFLDGPIAVP